MATIRRIQLAGDEHAVSPVIGTILMVAVTVVLGSAVYAAINGFGAGSIQEATNAVFKAQAVDTDGNGQADVLKLTYLTGPSNVSKASVAVTVKDSTGATPKDDADAEIRFTKDTNWSPGDFLVWNLKPGTYFMSVSMLGSTVLDQSVKIDE